MTVFKNNGKILEWTLPVDTFNNEILTHQATLIIGKNMQYLEALNGWMKEELWLGDRRGCS